MPMPVRSTSAGSTPTHCPQDPLSGVGGDMQEAFAQGESQQQSMMESRRALEVQTGFLLRFSQFVSCVLSFK